MKENGFTGVKGSDGRPLALDDYTYLGQTNFGGARRLVNGQDHAPKIAGRAEDYLKVIDYYGKDFRYMGF